MKATATGVITTMLVTVSLITWVAPQGGGNAGDACVLVDSQGRDVFRADRAGGDYDLSLNFGERGVPFFGLNLTTLSSGTLTILYR